MPGGPGAHHGKGGPKWPELLKKLSRYHHIWESNLDGARSEYLLGGPEIIVTPLFCVISRGNIQACSFVTVHCTNFVIFLWVTVELYSASFAPSSSQKIWWRHCAGRQGGHSSGHASMSSSSCCCCCCCCYPDYSTLQSPHPGARPAALRLARTDKRSHCQ